MNSTFETAGFTAGIRIGARDCHASCGTLEKEYLHICILRAWDAFFLNQANSIRRFHQFYADKYVFQYYNELSFKSLLDIILRSLTVFEINIQV
jgi:hypothetical protein